MPALIGQRLVFMAVSPFCVSGKELVQSDGPGEGPRDLVRFRPGPSHFAHVTSPAVKGYGKNRDFAHPGGAVAERGRS